VWAEAWERLEGEGQKERAWPHVVNDILLGMKWEDPALRFKLYEDVSAFDVGPCPGLLDRLEEMPALRDEHLSDDLFRAPAPLLYPVHRVLLNCSCAREHGERLQERLMHQRANRLSDVLLMAMGDFKVANKAVFQAILQQGMDKQPNPMMCDVAGRLLGAALKRLTRENMTAPWVPEALRWLPRLNERKAKPILDRVLNERRFFFFPVWPAECRVAAREAHDDVEMPVLDTTPREEHFMAMRAEQPGSDAAEESVATGAETHEETNDATTTDHEPDAEPVENTR
jgi:hypothetical protein